MFGVSLGSNMVSLISYVRPDGAAACWFKLGMGQNLQDCLGLKKQRLKSMFCIHHPIAGVPYLATESLGGVPGGNGGLSIAAGPGRVCPRCVAWLKRRLEKKGNVYGNMMK